MIRSNLTIRLSGSSKEERHGWVGGKGLQGGKLIASETTGFQHGRSQWTLAKMAPDAPWINGLLLPLVMCSSEEN